MISTASDIVASPAAPHRVTLRKTVVSCVVLAATLLLSIVALSLIGSESLPSTASLCALASLGTSPCGLTQDQFDILFQIRLPRLLLAAAVGAHSQRPAPATRHCCETRSPSLICWGFQTAQRSERWWHLCSSAQTSGRDRCSRLRAPSSQHFLFTAWRVAAQAQHQSV